MLIPLSENLEKLINAEFNKINNANLNLFISKFVDCWTDKWEFESEDKKDKTKGKSGFWQKAVDMSKNKIDTNLYKNFFTRWKSLLTSINTSQIKGKVHWRLVVGLGTGSVLKTSMILHHILGAPYIPGSALKGVVSTYYLEKNREALLLKMQEINSIRQKENKKTYESKHIENFAMNEDKNYITTFGNENNKGKVTFLDAYPISFPKLEMDIMNPHFGDYYSNKKPPADWMTPNPIKFITVAKDTEFIFAFKTDENNLVEEVKSLIKGALEYAGIGAKTSVGYGYFKNLEDYPDLPTSVEEPLDKVSEQTQQQPPAKYLKNKNELIDEYMNPDGAMKSIQEYEYFLKNTGKSFNTERKRQYEKAKNWFEKIRTILL